MKKIALKISALLKAVFGYGILVCLFSGGLTFFGYLFAIVVGGEIAAEICTFLYKAIFPFIITATSVLVIMGLACMYLNGEVALTVAKNKKK